MALFDRTAELIVGPSGGSGKLITDLRFEFVIEKSASETLNSSTVRVYNMSPESRRLVETPNNALILKAGYKQDVGALTIFVGIVRRVLTVRDGVDWVTEMELDDGLIAYRDAKASLTFGPGAAGVDVLTAVANQFALPVRPLPADIPGKTYAAGFSFVGRIRECMTKVCDYLGLEWSIQNQEIQILRKGGVVKDTAIVLSPDTGMIGSPELEAKTMTEAAAAKKGITTNQAGVVVRGTKVLASGKESTRLEIQGYKIKSLLQPTIQPGGYVQVKSAGIDGQFFRVEKVTHRGDTGGREWETEITVRFI
ncbi:MAG: phage protein [Burkholderiaceae bacterium]